jgi:hypothetical protein
MKWWKLCSKAVQTCFTLFANAKDQNCIARAWAKIVLDVNIAGSHTIDIGKAKNKFNYLKKIFKEYSALKDITGNPEEDDDRRSCRYHAIGRMF